MAPIEGVRHSNADVDESESAQSLPWEGAIPINRFWDSISYSSSSVFRASFSEQELAQLPIEPDSPASDKEKLELLLRLLQEKLTKEEAASAPKSLDQADYFRWVNLLVGIHQLQTDLGLAESEQTIRALVDRPAESVVADIRLQNILAKHLVRGAKFAEAEEREGPVVAWFSEHVGRDSPHALSARRTLVEAVWKQGASRRAEATSSLEEIKGLIDEMGSGEFVVYQKEERRHLQELMAELEDEK